MEPVFLFDLDGTLVDSVYQRVFAWKETLDAEDIKLSFWRIHRKIGMSGVKGLKTGFRSAFARARMMRGRENCGIGPDT
jgi:beta-phosphoglucomutase-like phosphatase (HAD superfamily)